MTTQLPSMTRLFEKMDEGMLVVDAQWRILYANDFARRYLNLSPTEDRLSEALIPKLQQRFIINTEVQEASGSEVRELTNEELDDLSEDEKSIAFEASSLPESSRPFTLSIYMSRSNEEGMRFMLLRDITAKRNEELWKSRLLSMISHKLMTPINVVKMFLSNMLVGVAGQISDKQRELLQKSSGKLVRLEKLVGRLIEYSALQSLELKGTMRPVDAQAVAEEVGKIIQRQYPDREIAFTVKGIDDAMVLARGTFLQSVFDSLFDNAVKFHPGPRVAIEVRFQRDPETRELTVTIVDDGPGIPPDIQHDLFSEFTQRDDDGTGNVEGIGLGLPLVKNLMGLFAGTASLHSEEGQGTTVTLTFPPPEE